MFKFSSSLFLTYAGLLLSLGLKWVLITVWKLVFFKCLKNSSYVEAAAWWLVSSFILKGTASQFCIVFGRKQVQAPGRWKGWERGLMGEHGPLNTYIGFQVMTALLYSFTLITCKKFALELCGFSNLHMRFEQLFLMKIIIAIFLTVQNRLS